MPGIIQIDSVKFILATAALTNAAEGVNGSLDSWQPMGEKSIGLDTLAAQYLELEKAMKAFHDLLLKDANRMTKVGREIFIADMKLAAQWD